MQRLDRIGAIVCLVIAGIALWQSMKVPMGNIRQPGPGFLPFWVGVILALLSAVLWFQAGVRKPGVEPVRFLSGEGKWPYVVAAGVGLLTYTFLLEPLGFIISTTILILWQAQLFEKGKWIRNLVVSILFSIVVYYLFAHVLEVMLPTGILYF